MIFKTTPHTFSYNLDHILSVCSSVQGILSLAVKFRCLVFIMEKSQTSPKLLIFHFYVFQFT